LKREYSRGSEELEQLDLLESPLGIIEKNKSSDFGGMHYREGGAFRRLRREILKKSSVKQVRFTRKRVN